MIGMLVMTNRGNIDHSDHNALHGVRNMELSGIHNYTLRYKTKNQSISHRLGMQATFSVFGYLCAKTRERESDANYIQKRKSHRGPGASYI